MPVSVPALLCAGSIVADVNIQGLPRFPVPGHEFTPATDVWHQAPARLLLGGTAGNSAVAYAALIGACDLAGPVGADAMGDLLAAAFARRAVRLIGPRGGATATHTIAIGHDGRRQGYYFPGESLDTDAVLRAWPGGNLLLTGIPLVMPRPRVAQLRALAARAHAGGGRVALDLGQASGDLWRLDELDDLREALDLLIGNAHEVELLLGAPYELARDGLRSAYEGPVVVKRGRDGATLDLDAHTPPADVPAARVNAVNPVGAGDAFDAGLLAAWCSGRTLLDAVRFACAVGAASVASPEGPQGVTRRAVDELLQE